MSIAATTREWWIATLLGQQSSAHPVFGSNIEVDVDGDLVTLSGTVENADEAEEIEREARSIDTIKTVVNRLQVTQPSEPYHFQTVIGIFPDGDSARLACEATSYWKAHDEEKATLFDDPNAARDLLRKRARSAGIPEETIDTYVEAVGRGKVLLVDRVPEDDALRLVSELEGSRAEVVRTLPPEPDAVTVD